MGLADIIYIFDIFFARASQNALSKMSIHDYFISMHIEIVPADGDSQRKTGRLFKKGESLREKGKRETTVFAVSVNTLSLHFLYCIFNLYHQSFSTLTPFYFLFLIIVF